MFRNTPTLKHNEFGKTYAACGGETVTNLGIKSVKCILPGFENGFEHKSFAFQVGDLVTRGLLAVSKICSLGAGVWFGPAPEFKSYIVWDKDAFIASASPKTELFMKNGTYMLPVREVYNNNSSLGGAEAVEPPSSGDSSGSGDPAGLNPGLGDRDIVDRTIVNEAIIEHDIENPPIKKPLKVQISLVMRT